MARSGMVNPIKKLRNAAQVSLNDYAIGGVNYWTDDQLQEILDATRRDVYFAPTYPEMRATTGGTGLYYDYYFSGGDWEEGTATFIIQDTTGGTPNPSGYSVNYRAGHIAFTADQRGTAYYLTARVYDINSAASEVWRTKAAQVASAYDFSADGHSMNRSQMQKHYLEMATHFAGLGAPVNVTMVRNDVNVCGESDD